MRRHIAIACTLLSLAALFPVSARCEERPLSTDRPDRTESAYTVPRGWVQVESDLVTWARFEQPGETSTEITAVTLNAKYGLLKNLDAQFLFTPWVHARTESAGRTIDDDGTGQAGLRLKYNVSGNDVGRSAMAVLPFALVPTRGDAVLDDVTYGMMLPIAFDIGETGSVGVMAGFTRVENRENWVHGSISFSGPLTENLAAFCELYVARNGFEEGAADDTTLDAGFTYAVGEDWQLDGGFYYGLTSSSEDLRVFVGASARFDL